MFLLVEGHTSWPSSIPLPPDTKQSGLLPFVVLLEILPDTKTKPRLGIKLFFKVTHVSFQFSPGKDSLSVALIHGFVPNNLMESHNPPLGTKLLPTQVERKQYQCEVVWRFFSSNVLSDYMKVLHLTHGLEVLFSPSLVAWRRYPSSPMTSAWRGSSPSSILHL